MPSHLGEDKVIDKLLEYKSTGFYIDVGANNPYTSSNSHAFYERGWSGIDIEPIPELCDILRQAHPRNLVVQSAISNFNGQITLYRINDNHSEGATVKKDILDRYKESEIYDEIIVPVNTLDFILEKHSTVKIDFVSIDVEGSEEQVLEGFDLIKWKPRILCIEATLPNTQIPNWGGWEPYVLACNYKLVHFDGYNRFYKLGE